MPAADAPPSEGNNDTTVPATGQNDVALDPESDENVPVEAQELQEALSRPPPVNSSYLPLPWKGRLGYACLNTYLRYSTPPVFCSRTCRIASILENRHPLQDPSQPPHSSKNRPDRTQPAEVARGQSFVEALGLANARDLIKLFRWNDRYGIKFMRLSSEMFPFASHKEYGYKLAPFASEVLAEAGKVIAELGHRVSVHPGQFTQLGSPNEGVVESSFRDLEYHSEMLQLLRLPPQQDRDAVMILHMGGVFGDKEATLDRFRENYKELSQDIKNRLVLENDDVSWSVHDLLPICEELNIPLVLDYHHHNIIFDEDKLREGTLDIMELYDRIKATWDRKNITQKMHYSEPEPSAVTKRQRRKHSPRVATLPPCDPTMDLMIEAKDKEQAVFELMRIFKLPGHELFSDIIPYTRTDENKPHKPPRKTKKNGGFVDLDGLVPPARTIPDEEVGMGGPDGRVYWPPGMEEWLRPKKIVRAKPSQTPKSPHGSKKQDNGGDEDAVPIKEEAPSTVTTPAKSPRVRRTQSAKKPPTRKRKASPAISTPSASEDEDHGLPETPKLRQAQSTGVRSSRRAKKVNYAEDESASPSSPVIVIPPIPLTLTTPLTSSSSPNQQPTQPKRLPKTLAPKPLPRSRWRASPPTTTSRLWIPPPRVRFPPATADRTRPQGKFFRLYRLLFGAYASHSAQSRLWDFRHETVPAFRHRAQSRIYRAIVKRQARLAQRRKTGGRRGIVQLLLGAKRRRIGGNETHTGGSLQSSTSVSDTSPRGSDGVGGRKVTTGSDSMSASSTWGAGSGGGGYERGGRRKKVFEYLKAANELRQNYAAQWAAQRDSTREYHEDYLNNTPGAFPDIEIARSGNEEMVIFPSYARRVVHDKRSAAASQARQRRDSVDTIDEYRGGTEDTEQGRIGWEEVDERTVVAVDVRGWIYSPHRGPMTRKHRLMIALARRLSGVPAPTSSTNDAEEESGAEKMSGRREDEIVDQEIQSIMKQGRLDSSGALKDGAEDGLPSGQSTPRAATEPLQMSKDELSMANAHLMERLRPFLTNPVAGVPVSVFFFNDGHSQSRSIITDESGHFSMRAALPFIPTHIRALASEDLSAMKEVEVIEPTGVSLISDIDDTVKHSAISNGAKEMFRNTFIRELSDLTVDGVADWYNKLAKMGVDIHYVSNAPWQLYPLLERYFKLVGLPPGSVHLKSYSGMLQGIFEPTSERKRGSLEQILRDFPDRKFILVGDSGEADLEVYTDIVMANPGRILGVFIRDITTTDRKQFFHKSVDHLESAPRTRSTPQLVDYSDMVTNRPALPPRRPADPLASAPDIKSLSTDDLIDLRDEEDMPAEPAKPLSTRTPPAKPSKPSALRSTTNISDQTETDTQSISSAHSIDPIKRKPVPPVPPRRLSPSKANTSTSTGTLDCDPESTSDGRRPSTASSLPTRPRPSPESSSSYTSPERSKATPPPPPPRRTNTASSTATAPAAVSRPTPSPSQQQQSHPQSLQKQQSYPVAAATAALQYASERIPWSAPPSLLRSTASNPSLNRSGSNTVPGDPQFAAGLPTKREELWARRWERAQDLLGEQGVVLGSWRTGKDMQDVSLWLVQEALKDGSNGNGNGNGKTD